MRERILHTQQGKNNITAVELSSWASDEDYCCQMFEMRSYPCASWVCQTSSYPKGQDLMVEIRRSPVPRSRCLLKAQKASVIGLNTLVVSASRVTRLTTLYRGMSTNANTNVHTYR